MRSVPNLKGQYQNSHTCTHDSVHRHLERSFKSGKISNTQKMVPIMPKHKLNRIQGASTDRVPGNSSHDQSF